MDFKDYYEILGVSPDADEKTIKQTYRKLARQYHPDVNPGNKDAEEKFKAINEAYQALSNPEQRKKYDELRAQYQRWQQTGRRPQDFNWQDWAAQPGESANVRYASAEDLEDLFGSDSPFSDFFTSIFGQTGGRARPTGPRKGQDVEAEVDLTLEEAVNGATRAFQIGDRRIEARIPPGVRTGSRVRLAGQGGPGRDGGQAGDVYLVVRLVPHPNFEVEGDDLHTEVPVDIYTAVAGGEVRVPTLDRPVMLKIPPKTQGGRTFRLSGRGMPRRADSKTRGDLFVRVKLMLPENMTEEELNTIRSLAAKRGNRQPV
ncbi:MAG TPA: DnaJ C-terminal domain-containing protein [Anaerolineales bacterium]|nr:DnaJ C-terminal domain-containing protein [Anaerolineales bacterium]